MSEATIAVCLGPAAPHWQLGARQADGPDVAMIGWRTGVAATDAGVPAAVARIIAEAATEIARVTFPSSELGATASATTASAGRDVIGEFPQAVGNRLRARLGLMPGSVLVSTTSAQTAARLFEDGVFPWWLQGQIALLSPLAADPPSLAGNELSALIDGDWTRFAAISERAGLLGVVRPGVDGAVAALVTKNPGFAAGFLAALKTATIAGDFEWQVVDESSFGDLIAE